MKISFERGQSKRRARRLGAALWGAVSAAALASCASTVGDTVPHALGGLAPDAPARPAEPAVYPAVHDMPPSRDARILTEAEIKKAQEELAALRKRQSRSAPRAREPADAAAR